MFVKKSYLLFVVCLLFFNCSSNDEINEPNEIVTVKDNGTTVVIDGKELWKLIKTTDGGYIGIAHSGDYEILKFDQNFNITWGKEYGGSENDLAESIIQTSDGGYLIVGWTKSSNGDVSNNYGDNDIWVCKIDANGNLMWEKNYGGSKEDLLRGENLVKQTSDGGFIFIGHTESSNKDVSINHGLYDIWVVKISSIGDIEFEKTFGGSSEDYGKEVLITQGGYFILSTVYSTDGDFNKKDSWLLKINESGSVIWKKALNLPMRGTMNLNFDGSVTIVQAYSFGLYVSVFNNNGNIVSTKEISTFSMSPYKLPAVNKVLQTNDKGFLIIGDLGAGNLQDAFCVKLNNNLEMTFSKKYSGSDFDKSRSIFPVSSDKYMYQFLTYSNPIDDITYSSLGASVIVRLEF